MTQIIPILSLADNAPIADGVTDPVRICQMWFGRMLIEPAGLDGKPFITLESSIDGVKYQAHNELTKIKISEDTAIRVGYVDALYYRLRIEANGSTTGTISARILLKHI